MMEFDSGLSGANNNQAPNPFTGLSTTNTAGNFNAANNFFGSAMQSPDVKANNPFLSISSNDGFASTGKNNSRKPTKLRAYF